MEWAESLERNTQVTDEMVRNKWPDIAMTNQIYQLKLLMQNWTDGTAEQIITYHVLNGLDAWKKLNIHQLPELEHRKHLLMNEFNQVQKATNLKEESKYKLARLTVVESDRDRNRPRPRQKTA